MQNKRDGNLPNGPNESFGQRVRRQRDKLGLTQQQLSDQLARFRVKLDTSAITRIENGSREPRLGEAQLIAQILEVPLQDLLPSTLSKLHLNKLWDELTNAQWGLVETVYEYGLTRRALLRALEEFDPAESVVEEKVLESMRESARLRAIADWAEIKAAVEKRIISTTEPNDQSVFDAET
ncbi:helix-turn-helix domain-containing protein [Mycobacterium marinum]|uniref:helix-turn-helix domain-containing protein n=1 Tax=Mycobacterium marinum TaxID=1781 RepID=UPI002359FEFE|nr:helix-turn-helix domain-containing protein [Mycobacterium marinum]MDC8982155.1 helix-turn-helix domain-containing protein [Mycobacterium marinum]MDC8998877.1 helix-turn-helix domain-containing protein [Mycobacterium marinum]MDC9009616.1 helix-turn-helix domain-containing protein [Mycobacterium marinum]